MAAAAESLGASSTAEPSHEVLAGLIERVTFHSIANGFCVLRIKARGHRLRRVADGSGARPAVQGLLSAHLSPKETLENPSALREDRPVIAVVDSLHGQQAARIRRLLAIHGQEAGTRCERFLAEMESVVPSSR